MSKLVTRADVDYHGQRLIDLVEIDLNYHYGASFDPFGASSVQVVWQNRWRSVEVHIVPIKRRVTIITRLGDETQRCTPQLRDVIPKLRYFLDRLAKGETDGPPETEC